MNIRIGTSWEVYPRDRLNWSVKQLKTTTDENGKTTEKWILLDRYFGTPQAAIHWVYDQLIIDDPTLCQHAADIIRVLEKARNTVFDACDTISGAGSPSARPTPLILADPTVVRKRRGAIKAAKTRAEAAKEAKTTKTDKSVEKPVSESANTTPTKKTATKTTTKKLTKKPAVSKE